MKAAQINNYGGSEVVKINDNAPKPTVSQGQLLVEVYAAGVNPVDWKIREGYMRQVAPLKFPATLGGDYSGVVTEVGEGVAGFKKAMRFTGRPASQGAGQARLPNSLLQMSAPRHLSQKKQATLKLLHCRLQG
jgi:NADPH:quinone reductase-like Zn-dependent oxidoreductase